MSRFAILAIFMLGFLTVSSPYSALVPEPSVTTIDNVRYTFFIQERKTHSDALTKCKQLNGELMRFPNQTFNTVFSSIMHQRANLQIQQYNNLNTLLSFWVNAQRQNKLWFYDDGGKIEYDNFVPPLNVSQPIPDEDCAVALIEVNKIGQWKPQNCAEMRSFICKVVKDPDGDPVTQPIETATIRDILIIQIVILIIMFLTFFVLFHLMRAVSMMSPGQL
jgi:hypothetical protein